MGAMALLLLFLASSLSQSAAAESRPSLQQAVESALNPTVTVATLAYDGRMEREKDILCLATTSICGSPWFLRSPVACCPHKGQHKSVRDILPDPWAIVGSCKAYITYGSLPLTTNIYEYPGHVHCKLRRDADSCVEGCGDLVLTGEGETLQFSYAVIEGPLPIFADGTCRDVTGNRMMADTVLPRGLLVNNATDATKRAGRDGEARQGPTATVNLAYDLLSYSASITVKGNTRPSRWREGRVTFAAAYWHQIVTEETLAGIERQFGTLPRIRAEDLNTFRFELFKEEEERF